MEIRSIVTALQSLFSNNGIRRRETVITFSHNIALVAVGLRTAFLVDSISFSLESAQELSLRLRNLGDFTRDLLVVREGESEQTFVVNSQLLLHREQEDMARSMVYVGVGGSAPVIMSKPEPLLSALLDHLLERARNSPAFVDLDLSTILPNSSDASYRSTLIALAGYLLEYPIVYSLYDEERHSAALRNCLGGQELSLIKIALRESSSGDSHPLMAFSFPRSIIAAESLSTYEQDLIAFLRHKFSARLPRQVDWDSVDVTLEGPISQDRFSL